MGRLGTELALTVLILRAFFTLKHFTNNSYFLKYLLRSVCQVVQEKLPSNVWEKEN
jgi:hypothetical protein